MTLKSLDFGRHNTRIQHVLECNEIYTRHALELISDKELMSFPNMGKACVDGIRAVVPSANWQVWTPEMQEAEIQREYGR